MVVSVRVVETFSETGGVITKEFDDTALKDVAGVDSGLFGGVSNSLECGSKGEGVLGFDVDAFSSDVGEINCLTGVDGELS